SRGIGNVYQKPVLEDQTLIREDKQKPPLTVMLAQDIPEQMIARAVQINK
ncbi:hypothetical protein JMA02_18000, partial [Acinetobacter baumannii]|nr:hypothetical protein [Acinetobacter baumannii]